VGSHLSVSLAPRRARSSARCLHLARHAPRYAGPTRPRSLPRHKAPTGHPSRVRSRAPPQPAPRSRPARSEAAAALCKASHACSRPAVSETIAAWPCFIASSRVRPPSRHTPFHRRSHPLRPPHRSPSCRITANRAGVRRLPHPRLHPPDAAGEDPSLGLRHRLGVPYWSQAAVPKAAVDLGLEPASHRGHCTRAKIHASPALKT
jgi:hypothetical protein